ncbi:hypothetical protein EW145_g4921 [Phellinidium pouzarii]|uniref:C2H2-type domain-containing protein n=1 Tax=Phellinidium pouzarii TaxID=167371 RepID=A0A4S4L1S7_9AGAM|nr:hypothetical protein EW145_g4921 [Phellinidium pouzarii]
MAGPLDDIRVGRFDVDVPPQKGLPSGLPVPSGYLQLSDLRTTRASDSSYSQDAATNSIAISHLCHPPLQSAQDKCIDCVVDCDGKDCQLFRPPSKEKCTEQCIVVSCSDEKSCAEVCLEETCEAEPCDGGASCTGTFEEFLQCCTDLHAYTGALCPDQTTSHFNWDCSIGDFLNTGVPQNLSGCIQLPELDARTQAFPNFAFADASLSSAAIDILSQGAGGSTNFALPSNQTTISPPQERLPVENSSPQFTCRWIGCSSAFNSMNDLAVHVNSMHLRPSSPPPRPFKRQCVDSGAGDIISCRWNDCQIYPDFSAFPGPSTGLRPEAALSLLSSHLFHDHLGLSTPPTLSTLNMTNFKETRQYLEDLEKPSDLQNQVPETSQPQSSLPADMPSKYVQLIPEPALTYSTPEPSPPPLSMIHEATHDCATTAHVCHWMNCGESFDTCAALTGHLTAAHVGGGKSRYDCHWRDCTRSGAQGFASKQKILRHLQAHTGHRPFACSECGLHFSEAATLQQHIRRHTQEKPFVCDFPGCGKAFAITGALTIHKRTHNGERPFKCKHCNRAFAESSNLSKHLKTHTGDRPYRCLEPGCGKAFARPDQLQRHRNVHTKKTHAFPCTG